MKRYIALLLTMVCILALAGCGRGSHTGKDYPAAIMVEGTIYLKSASAMPAEIDESAIIGYTTSYTDTYPEKDGETNFNRELNMPYARVEGGIAVLYENEWYLCTPKDVEASADHGPLVTVESNGERVQPYPLFLWAETWTEGHGWLNADGANFLETHSEFSEEIPAITYGDNFEIHYRDGVSFLYLSVYNADFERIHHNVEQSVLSDLKDGEYYIGLVVEKQGKYIESEKTHEMKGYECVLKLIKQANELNNSGETGEQYVDPNELGIEMTLQSVSATSAMIVFTLHSDDKSDEARTGAAYWLEKEENGSWERVPMITDHIAWFADTYTIKANVETEIPVDWSNLYGELGQGKYRIGKEVLGEREPGHSTWYTYYAEFEIVNIAL